MKFFEFSDGLEENPSSTNYVVTNLNIDGSEISLPFFCPCPDLKRKFSIQLTRQADILGIVTIEYFSC